MGELGLLSFSILLFVSSQFIEGKQCESELLDTIFKGYDKRIRPVEDYHLPIVVNFSITFQQILKVDEKNQALTSNIIRSHYWQDNSLKWDPKDFANITYVSVVRSKLFTPDVHLYNAASFDKQVGSQTKAVIYKDGVVIDVLPMLLKSSCKIDVTWFPFDEQKCFLIFGSWSSPSKFLKLQVVDNGKNSNYEFMENEEWKILTIGAETIANTYPCCPDDKYIRIKYTVRLKRRTFYYFFNLLVPCGLIGFLAVLGFTLPPDSGEKLSLGATLLFSLIVFLNMIGDSMPANSDAIPLLGTYFNCVMVTIALSVVSTIVINLNLNAMHVKEVQGRSKKVFLVWLPWILRMNSPPCLVSQQDKSKKKVGDHANTSHLSHSENACSLPSQQWKFIAIVVDRLCLLLSLVFTFSSVIVFLIYAF